MTNQAHSKIDHPKNPDASGFQANGALKHCVIAKSHFYEALAGFLHIERTADADLAIQMRPRLDAAALLHKEMDAHVHTARRAVLQAHECALALSAELDALEQIVTPASPEK